ARPRSEYSTGAGPAPAARGSPEAYWLEAEKMTRRTFWAASAWAVSAVGSARTVFAAPARTALGIARDSLPLHRFKDTLAMLDYCASLGAGGIQAPLTSTDSEFLKRLRTRAEQLGMYVEVQSGLMRLDREQLERTAAAAAELGAGCLRMACLGGRRYE